MIVTKSMQLIGGLYVVPEPGTVLHQMFDPSEPAEVVIGGRRITLPPPRFPKVTIRDRGGEERPVILLGPPHSICNRLLSGNEDAEEELRQWVLATARKRLQRADALVLDGVMSYAIGLPVVPEGEVWIGMNGLKSRPRESGICIRWPIASSNPLRCTVRAVPGKWGIFINDTDLVGRRQGDSDGDLLFVAWFGKRPAEERELDLSLDRLVDLDFTPEFPDVKQLSPEELAIGYAAKSLVGLATWWTWAEARWGYDHVGEEAWKEAYDRYLPIIETMMDGRKTGQSADLGGLGEGLPEIGTLVNSALPGVRAMVASRSRFGAEYLRMDWRQLVRQYWSLRWAPEGIDVEEVRDDQ